MKNDLQNHLRELLSVYPYRSRKFSDVEKSVAAFKINNVKCLKEQIELASLIVASEFVNDPSLTLSQVFDKLIAFHNSLPALNNRTSTTYEMQQYSTPIPVAYLMQLFVQDGDKKQNILDTTAGNGALLFASYPLSIYANELDSDRFANLNELIGARSSTSITNMDALEYNKSAIGKYVKGKVNIISNPPFATMDVEYEFGPATLKHLDTVLPAMSLDLMPDHGKAAIIVGGHLDYDSQGRIQSGKNRIFFTYLYQYYNVVDVINLDRSAFTKSGTSFPTKIILISGRKPEPSGRAAFKNEMDTKSYKIDNKLFEKFNYHFAQNRKERIQRLISNL